MVEDERLKVLKEQLKYWEGIKSKHCIFSHIRKDRDGYMNEKGYLHETLVEYLSRKGMEIDNETLIMIPDIECVYFYLTQEGLSVDEFNVFKERFTQENYYVLDEEIEKIKKLIEEYSN
ncbi:hypothetical protein LJC10_00390 [Selenomonadales bacterium OttesenSCG-928-I06]|nr:hypothetical protein [Selenomonadales bacterium OttesenSCG-928-I06]